MMRSLQQLLYYFPLHKLSFLTTIPQELLFFEETHESISDNWLDRPSIYIVAEKEQYEKLTDLEVTSRMIQDTNLVAVILCSKNQLALPNEILALFQECGIPVLQIYDSSAGKWFEQQEDEFLPYSQVTLEVSGLIERSFTEIATDFAQAFRTPLLYLNDDAQVVWETGTEEALKQAWRWLNVYQRQLVNETFVADGMDGGFKPYPLRIPGLAPQWFIVSNDLASWQKQLIDKLAGLTSIFLQSETESKKFFEKVKSHFVYDLLYHKFESQKVMVEQGKIWGWNLEKPHHLYLIDIDFSTEWVGEEPEPSIREIIERIEAAQEDREACFHVFPFDDQIVGLLEDEKNGSTTYALEFATKLEQQLSSIWGKGHFVIGIGKWYQKITNLNKSYQEAKLALQFGEGWYPDQQIFHYNDLGVIRLLMHVHQGILVDFSQDYLAVLMDHDREVGTEYLKTLQLLIQYRWRVDDVAQVLFVHPNTLRNRMKKIEEILKIDFQDSDELANIMIAVKIHTLFAS